jgi:ATP synthase protein I
MPETTATALTDAGTSPDEREARMRRLEARLAEARARRAPAPPIDEHYTRANVAWRMVTELVAGIGIGLAIGLGLDALLGTEPFLLVLFILLGFTAGVRVMMRTAQEIGEQAMGEAARNDG